MSLWNWVWEALTGRSNRVSSAARSHDRRSWSTSGTASTAEAERSTPGHEARIERSADEDDSWWADPSATKVELSPILRPSLSSESLALENVLVSHLDGRDLTLPPMPQVPERVLRRLTQPNCKFSQIADDIAEDPVITGAVLRTANSPLYRGLEKITKLEAAVTRLGQRTIRTLMLAESLRAAAFQKKFGDNTLSSLIWRRSIAGGYTAQALAPLVGINSEDAFLYGLLHDIGNVVVLRLVSSHEAMTRDTIHIDTFEYLCFECHQEFGELVADEWKLPPKLRSLIASHHTSPAPDDELRRERWLLQLTDMICAMLGYAPTGPYDLLNTLAVRELKLDGRNDFLELLCTLPSEISETVASL